MASTFGLDDRESAREFASLFADLDSRLRALEMTNQLVGASIEDSTLAVYDADGELRTTIGAQVDGTVGVVHHNAPPPPTPSDPLVSPVLAGLLVTWDGTWSDADSKPLDFTRVQVHLGATAEFLPSPVTVAATISNPDGATVTLATTGYATQYVRLVGVNVAEVPGTPSGSVAGTPKMVDGPDLSSLLDLATWLKDSSVAGSKIVAGTIGANLLAANSVVAGKIDAGAIRARELAAGAVEANHIKAGAVTATHIKAGAITTDKLAVGVNGNLLPDPSFELGYIAGLTAGMPGISVESGGNRSAKALKIGPNGGARQVLLYQPIPVSPGERYWLASDYAISPDYAGGGVYLWLRWLDPSGAWISSSEVTITGKPQLDWQRVKGVAVAPDRAATAVFLLDVAAPTAGSVWFDNVELRPVMASNSGGSRAEVSPDGLRLFDGEGEEAVSLVTGRPNYLTMSADGVAVATIDQAGNAGFSDLSVAGELTVGGEPVSALIAETARGMVALDWQVSSITGGSTETGFVELAFQADANRMYRIVLDVYAEPSAAGGSLTLRFRDGGANTPTIGSPQLTSGIYPMPTNSWQRIHFETIRSGRTFGEGLCRLLATFVCQQGPSGQTVRLFGGDTFPSFMYVEDVGPHVPETGLYNRGGGTTTPPLRKYTKTYAASWSGSYSNRGPYNAYYGNKLLQGRYSSTHGVQAGLVGFPASLASDLAGATILEASVYLYFEHWYYNAGGTTAIKAHSHASRPGTFSSDSETLAVKWARNQGKWVNITSVFDSTRWRGIALDPMGTGLEYYGRARGVGEAYPPQLRVTYTK